MEYIETTISEHIFNQGMLEGEAKGEIKGEVKGEARGEAKGEIIGQIKILETLYTDGILTEEQFNRRVAPLRQKLLEMTRVKQDRAAS